MADCILGIKKNGISLKIDSLKIESDQTPYDYICDVTLSDSWNGNGTYNISITDKNYVQGLPLGKWRITKAYIDYDWGKSVARFVLTDENGTETKPIKASEQRGSASSEGFNTNTLARSIFSKAQMIISEYPSAHICDDVLEFDELTSKYTWSNIKRDYEKGERNIEGYIDLIEYLSKNVYEYIELYKALKKKLEGSEDPMIEQLLFRITNDCQNILRRLPFKPFTFSD